MLKSVFEMAALYFPFTDVIVADPYGDIASALKIAFVVGQSRVVGDTRTDIIAVATDSLQAQILDRHRQQAAAHDPGDVLR